MEMDSAKINLILEKYWLGDTSLEEEDALRSYFSGEVAVEHLSFRPLFGYFNAQQQVAMPSTVARPLAQPDAVPKPEAKVRSLWKKYRAVAAVLILAIGALLFFSRTQAESQPEILAMQDTYDNPEEAYAEVVEALQFISAKMNKGLETTSSSLEKIKSLNEQLAN